MRRGVGKFGAGPARYVDWKILVGPDQEEGHDDSMRHRLSKDTDDTSFNENKASWPDDDAEED